MASVFDYLKWRGDLNIKNDPINDIDALILSRLSYFPFDDIVDDDFEKGTTVLSASKQFLRSDKNRDLLLWKGDSELLEETAKTPRFCNMNLSGYVNIIENEKQMQFSAVVIEISKTCLLALLPINHKFLTIFQYDVRFFIAMSPYISIYSIQTCLEWYSLRTLVIYGGQFFSIRIA